jgi:hypothetical protein
MNVLATLDWRAYVIDGGDGYFVTRNIPIPDETLGQYRLEMSVCASGSVGNVRVEGNYKIIDGEGRQIADQRGIPIHYSDDLVKSAERWLAHYGAA